MNTNRGLFASRLGVVLATAGSAVGLGNIWRFPYMTGQNGGAAFILIYFACVLVLGIPGMVSEFIVGRHGASNAARAYGQLVRQSRLIGIMGIVTSMIILGFYAVVAGWCLQYLLAATTGSLKGDANYVAPYFASFSSDGLRPVLWTIAFILITHFVVSHGVRNGIERASKLLMPVLILLLLVLVVASCMLPGAWQGIEFLLKPDFSKVSGSVFLEALGQAFFSLSLGTACLCTYASYFSRQTNLLGSAVQIALLDSVIAILAGLMIFPAAFSVGVSPDSGPSLIFITLPNVFQQAFAAVPSLGYAIGILFYALLSLAALTSTISMHEIGTAYFYEELHITRRQGAWIETAVCCFIGVLCSLSMGAVDQLRLFGMPFLNFCDFLTAQILLPLGAFLTSLLMGWMVPRQIVSDELTNWDTLWRSPSWRSALVCAYLFLVRFVCPLCILAIFLHQLGVL